LWHLGDHPFSTFNICGTHRRLLAAGVLNLQSSSAYVWVGAIMINSDVSQNILTLVSWFIELAFIAAINVVWWLSVFVTSIISSVVYQVLDALVGLNVGIT
jgi:hypothetical protein